MPLYEHVFISRQDLSSAQAEGLIEHFATVVADNGGAIVEREYWGVKTLAYRINKNRKAHFTLINIDGPASAVAEMERQMGINEDILRVLTIRVEAHEDGPSAMMRKREDSDRDGDRGERRGPRGDRPPRRQEGYEGAAV